MRTKRTFWKNLLLALVSLLVSLLFVELIVRYFVPVRNVGPSFSTYDPYYGKVLKTSISVKRIATEFTMSFSTNADAFRGPELTESSVQPILFLGDSFTMGHGVNNGEEFPALIRSIPVVNAGMGDNGNGWWVKFLRNRAAEYNPQLVILQIHANDIEDNIREKLFSLTDTGELQELPIKPPGIIRIAQRLQDAIPGLANSYLIGLIREVLTSLLPSSTEKVNEGMQLTYKLLQESLNISASNNWPVVILLTGMPSPQATEFSSFFTDKTLATIQLPHKQQRPDLHYNIDDHWNAAGHRYAASKIIDMLKANGFLPVPDITAPAY